MSRSWVQRAVALPVSDFSLKTVAGQFGYRFSAADVDGLQVGCWYSQYRQTGKPFNVSKVRTYNRDDVLAMEHVLISVRKLAAARGSLVEPALDAPVVPFRSRPRRGPRRACNFDEIVERYRAALDARVARQELSLLARDTAVLKYEAAMRSRLAPAA